MAGIYIHVPYCKQRCIYCDFYTQVNLKSRSEYVRAVIKEIDLRKEYIKEEPVKTIYFGGGTPSLLRYEDYQLLFQKIFETFKVEEDAEITLEANPDDLSGDYLQLLKSLPFNRLSVGIQSFDDRELVFLNRRHTAKEAIDAVQLAQKIGFANISIDLMYGLPNQTLDIWAKNLGTAVALNIQHISSYHLIYEEGTKLYKLFQVGKINQVDEELSVNMFSMMIDKLEEAGFEHYEISNFAKPGLLSQHNTSYWLGEKYLGLGSAAHSFNGKNREFNIASISKYIKGVDEGQLRIEREELDFNTRYNEFVLTGLRTKWGIDLNILKQTFGENHLNYCLNNAEKYIHPKDLILEGNILKLSKQGIFISDGIMSDLMWV